VKTHPHQWFNVILLLALLLPIAGHPTAAALSEDIPTTPQAAAPVAANASEILRNSPVMFIENVGQFDEGARFQVRGGNGTLWLADDALWITVVERSVVSDQRSARFAHTPESPFDQNLKSKIENRQVVNLRLSFPNANPNPRLEPFDRLETTVSYFLGNDPDSWRPAVPVWGGVRYVDLYPGIDLEVTSEGGQFVQRLHAQPGADLSQVQLRVEGAEVVEWAGTEGLRFSTAAGNYTLPLLTVPDVMPNARPVISAVKAATFDIAAPFTLSPHHLVAPSYTVQNQNSSSHLLYGTFLGGGDSDYGYGITIGRSGAAYVTGGSSSADFPTTPGVFSGTLNGSADVFVLKVTPHSSILDFATFIGGSGSESGRDIAIDDSETVYIVGSTGSRDFPITPGTYRSNCDDYYCSDAFVARLDATGTTLIFATYLGGDSMDWGKAIAVDQTGDIYVSGENWYGSFPTTDGAYQTSYNGGYSVHNAGEAFIVKLNSDASALLYSTYLGGKQAERLSAMAVDDQGHVYVTGSTRSADFPTTLGAYDRTCGTDGKCDETSGSLGYGGPSDVYVTKIAPDGSYLVYSTFVGSSGIEVGNSLTFGSNGSIYVVGRTNSSLFPTTDNAVYRFYNGGYDAFLLQLNRTGSSLLYSTFLGGDNNDEAIDVYIKEAGDILIVGSTSSFNFPITSNAYDSNHNGGNDVFLTVINPSNTDLSYSSFIGGSNNDQAAALALDELGCIFIIGHTSSDDFPTTPDAFDTTHNGNSDAFIVKLNTIETGPDPASLILSLEDWIHPAANLRVGVWLHSEAPDPITYTVRATLSQAGQAVDVLENPLIASVNNAPYHAFDFGVRDAGPYEVLVEALLDDTVLASAVRHTRVLSSTDIAQAFTAAAELTRAAHWEFSEGQEIVVEAYGESLSELPGEVVDFFAGKFLELIFPVGEAALVPNNEIAVASYELTAKLLSLDKLFGAMTRPVIENQMHYETNMYLNPRRRQVDANRSQYEDFVLSHSISWNSDLTLRTQEYWDVISNRVEEERAWGLAAPPVFIWQNSLAGQQSVFLVYKALGAVFGVLALLAGLAVIIWAIVGSGGGALPGILMNLARLKPLVGTLKHVAAAVLVLLALDMDFKLQYTVAPAIETHHQNALHELLDLPDVNLSLDAQLQTKLYSADGRLLQLQTHSPAMAGRMQDMTAGLPAGTYRAVASAPVIGDLGNGAQVGMFEVAAPQVALDLTLAASHLEISQTLQANLWVTNTDTLTGTGSLALLVEASDGDNGDAWLVDLDAGAQQQYELAFVPPEAGSYVLRARLFGADGALLALRESGYVVGDGPALAIEPDTAATWNPGELVTAQVVLSNAGNESASGVLDVVTLDRESHQALYTTTLAIDLLPDTTETYTVTALTDAQPGRYSINLLLDDEAYMSLPFVVAAENTLLVIAEPEPRYQLVGQEVAIAIEVVDMIYTHTDATVAGYVLDPLFASHPLSISHNGEGLYSVSYTPDLSGTYEVFITATREHWRSATTSAHFIVQQASYLAATVSGNPQVSQLRPVTLTVHNEHQLPVIGALVTISGTQEYVTRVTNAAGEALFPLMPSNGTPYEVKIEKPGYATTRLDLAVEPARIYLPLVLRQ